MKLHFTLPISMTRLLALGMLLMMGLTACHRDDDEVVPAPTPGTDPDPVVVDHKTFRLTGPGDRTDIVLPRDGGMYSLFLTVTLPEKGSDQENSDWILKSDDYTWFKFNSFSSDASGSGSKLISFKVGSNEGTERSLILTVSDPLNSNNKVTIKVRQLSKSGTNAELSDKMAHHGMGYGYNIQMKYASDTSFSAYPILDYDKIMSLERQMGHDIISEVYRYREEIEMLSTNTLTEMSRSFTDKMSKGDTFWGTAEEISNFVTKTKRVDQTCSYIRLKEIVSSRTFDWGMITSYKREEVFTKEFCDALDRLSANNNVKDQNVLDLIANYGTHLCISADLGGYVAIKTVLNRDTLFTHEEITRTISKKRFFFSTSSEQKKEISDHYLSSLNPDYKFESAGGNGNERKKIEEILVAGGQPDLTQWQASLHVQEDDEQGDSKLAVVGVRIIPIYDLISDVMVRKHVREVMLDVFSQNHIVCPEMNMDNGYDCYSFSLAEARLNDSRLTVGQTSEMTNGVETKTARVLVTQEYVPSIRRDALVEVAYPMVNGRPYLTRGIFTGDKNHRPGIIRWYNDDSTYEPDTISRTDPDYAAYFDDNGKLKQVYYYFHDIHVLPLDNLEETKNTTLSYTFIDEYAKVGSHYWTRKTDNKQLQKDVKLSSLPTQSEVQSLCNVVPYELIENKTLGLDWPIGFERGTSGDKGTQVENTNIYLPVRYQKDAQSPWELRVTRLSPARSVPLYTPAIICPTGEDGSSLLMTPVHCSTSFKY